MLSLQLVGWNQQPSLAAVTLVFWKPIFYEGTIWLWVGSSFGTSCFRLTNHIPIVRRWMVMSYTNLNLSCSPTQSALRLCQAITDKRFHSFGYWCWNTLSQSIKLATTAKVPLHHYPIQYVEYISCIGCHTLMGPSYSAYFHNLVQYNIKQFY